MLPFIEFTYFTVGCRMDRQLMLRVLVPVAGLAILLVIVGAVIALTNLPATETSDNPAPTNSSGASATPRVAGEGGPRTEGKAAPELDFPIEGAEWVDVDASKYPGLKYWDVVVGTGNPCPTIATRPGLIPIMHYTGWLTNGSRFDSSIPKGSPLSMTLASLIPGWQTGVPGMKVGGKRRLLIPSQFGYGERGSGANIPPNSTLVFEMELVDIK
jgi:hypothetical protein